MKAKPASANGNGTAATAATVDCDRCGKSVKPNGLAVHKARAHGVAGAHTERRVPKPDAADEHDDDTIMLRCNDCDYTTDTHSFAKLRTHTTIAHQRVPYPGVEDRPRGIGAADLAAG